MKTILRWFLLLPAAIGAMLLAQLICGFIALLFGDSFPLNLIGTRFVGEWLAAFIGSRAFVIAGASVAPSHKFIVACGLAAIMIAFAAWSIYTVATLPGFSLGATVVWPMPFGLRSHTSAVWWQLLVALMWALSSVAGALHLFNEERGFAT